MWWKVEILEKEVWVCWIELDEVVIKWEEVEVVKFFCEVVLWVKRMEGKFLLFLGVLNGGYLMDRFIIGER